VGKSTLFNALTRAKAESANYPFSTVTPNIGVAHVPDARLKPLEDMYKAKKVTPATVDFVDIAGLVKGAGRGEGLGNRFLTFIREVDALVHVVRCFSNPDVAHIDSRLDPRRDVAIIGLELIFADLEVIERRLGKAGSGKQGGDKSGKSGGDKASKPGGDKSGKPGGDKSGHREFELAEKLKPALEDGIWVSQMELDDEEKAIVAGWGLLTGKPVLYAANVSEKDLQDEGASNEHVAALRALAAEERAPVFMVCAKVEEEIAQFDEAERTMFMQDLGVAKSSLDSLIEASYDLLGLASFLTAGPKEVRAWTIPVGCKAPQAASVIHSDFERGFIRAEVISFADYARLGSESAARAAGVLRVEGKEYVVKDGDVVHFLFNV
jgi:GTP-binding protein YchF